MSKFLSLSLCLLVAVTIAVTADAQDHKIPAIPDEFSCTIEANIANNGYTLDIREYYDVQNNRIRMERHSRGSSMINIFDFNNTIHYRIDDGNCTTQNTHNMTHDRFTDGSGDLRPARDLYRESADMNFTYVGERTIRNIRTERWETSVSRNISNHHFSGVYEYELVWYFSHPNWTTTSESGVVPVRTSVIGTFTDSASGDIREFNHLYEWVDFVTGVPDEDLFNLGEKYFCPFYENKPIPNSEALSYYQSSILGINYQTNEVYNFEEYYAYPENMYLVNIEKEDGFEVLLIDGPNNRNVTWTTATEGKDCVSGPIGSDDEMKGLYNSTTHHLNHLKLRDPNMDGTFVYGGVTKIRGVTVDAFRSHSSGSAGGSAYEYFTYWYWLHQEISDGSTIPVPFHMEIQGTWVAGEYSGSFHIGYEYSHVSYQHIPTEFFDLPEACGLNPDDDEEDEGYTTSTVAIASAGFLLLGVIIGGLLHMCWVGKAGSNISNDDRQGAVRL